MNGNSTASAGSPAATGVHIPTFVWTMIAVIAALVVYHVIFGK